MLNLKNEVIEVLTNLESELNNENAITLEEFHLSLNHIVNRYVDFTNRKENEYGQQDITCELSFCDSEQPEEEDFSFMIEVDTRKNTDYVTHVYLTK